MKYGYDFPLSAQIELTSECNLKCVHCYNYWRSSETNLPVFPQEKIKHTLAELVNNGIFHLAITGGEPLLHPGFTSLLECASSLGISCWVNSNLTVLSPQTISALINHNVTIRTSLLSYNPTTHDRIVCFDGAFKKTISGIEQLKNDLPVHVNMVVMQENRTDVLDTGLFLKSIGVSNFTATKISPVFTGSNYDGMKSTNQSVVKMLDDLLELRNSHSMNVGTLTVIPACIITEPEKYSGLLLSNPCIAGKTECAISADGYVKTCVRDDVAYGNLFKENLSDIWSRWDGWENDAFIPEQCKYCRHLSKCGGGCRIDCKCCGNIKALDEYAVNAGLFKKE